MTVALDSAIDLDTLLKRLHLANARRAWRDLVQRAEKGIRPIMEAPRGLPGVRQIAEGQAHGREAADA